jgi:hypothetical protein
VTTVTLFYRTPQAVAAVVVFAVLLPILAIWLLVQGKFGPALASGTFAALSWLILVGFIRYLARLPGRRGQLPGTRND